MEQSMLFRTTVERITLTFKVMLVHDDETRPICSQIGFLLRIWEISRSGRREIFRQKNIMVEFLFGSNRHRDDVKRLLVQSEIWPQDDDFEPILDMAFSDAYSKLETDNIQFGLSRGNRIPMIILDVAKWESEDEDDDDVDVDDDVAMAVEQSMQEALKTTPATKESIKNLKKVKLENKNTDKKCTICMEQLVFISETDDGDNEILSMPCSHLFHGGCIQQWLDMSHQCPLCRFLMPTDNACSCHPKPN